MTKNILVTGVGSELGKQVSLFLTNNGHHVKTHTKSGKGSNYGGNLTRTHVVDGILKDNPNLDVLICCHGGHKFEDTIENMLDANLISTMNICDRITNNMEKNGHGHILIIGSYAGCFGKPTGINYAISKAAVHHYIRCKASESKIVQINGIALGNLNGNISLKDAVEFICSISFLNGISGQILRLDGGKHTFPC